MLGRAWKAIKAPAYIYGPGGTGTEGYMVKQAYKKYHKDYTRHNSSPLLPMQQISRREWERLGEKAGRYLDNPAKISRDIRRMRAGAIGLRQYPWQLYPELKGE